MNQPLATTRVPELDPATWADDDEIDLFELAEALWEGKLWIVGAVVAALIAAAAYLWSQAPVYESRGVIEIGHVPTIGAVQDPGALVQELTERHGLAQGSRNLVSGDGEPRLVEVGPERGGAADILVFTAQGADAVQTERFLRETVDRILSEHQTRYDGFLGRLETALDRLAEREATLDQQREQLLVAASPEGRIGASSPPVDATLAIQAARLSALRLQLIDERARLESALWAGDNDPSRWLSEPATSERPVAPRTNLILVLGAVCGGILGVGFVLLMRAWRRRYGW